MTTDIDEQSATGRRFSGWQVLAIVSVAILVAVLLTVFILKRYLWPAEFRPVELSYKEEQVLAGKLEALGLDTDLAAAGETALTPEPYTEEGASRDVYFDERELNALLARNTSMAQRLAIDLSDNLASAKLLVELPQDFPLLAGQTLRVTAGMEMAFDRGRPVVVLKGVSLMGVPVPNAWLGNLKNVDLVEQFGNQSGFWKTFSDGVELIEVTDGRLHIRLRE